MKRFRERQRFGKEMEGRFTQSAAKPAAMEARLKAMKKKTKDEAERLRRWLYREMVDTARIWAHISDNSEIIMYGKVRSELRTKMRELLIASNTKFPWMRRIMGNVEGGTVILRYMHEKTKELVTINISFNDVIQEAQRKGPLLEIELIDSLIGEKEGV